VPKPTPFQWRGRGGRETLKLAGQRSNPKASRSAPELWLERHPRRCSRAAIAVCGRDCLRCVATTTPLGAGRGLSRRGAETPAPGSPLCSAWQEGDPRQLESRPPPRSVSLGPSSTAPAESHPGRPHHRDASPLASPLRRPVMLQRVALNPRHQNPAHHIDPAVVERHVVAWSATSHNAAAHQVPARKPAPVAMPRWASGSATRPTTPTSQTAPPQAWPQARSTEVVGMAMPRKPVRRRVDHADAAAPQPSQGRSATSWRTPHWLSR